MKTLVYAALITLFSVQAVHANDAELQAAIEGEHRTEAWVARDQYRHPLQTLKLFDVQPQHTVVEVWPGGGWYTEILAPYLKENGKLIAAHYDSGDEQASYRPTSRERFEAKLNADAAVYGKVQVSSLMFDEEADTLTIAAAKDNSVDRVLTFRSAHGMVRSGVAPAAFEHFFAILKPGGKLGIVQHMADPEQDWMSRNIGYVGRDYIIALATGAGFVLEAEGFFNRNPLDVKRYPKGVWNLPPTLHELETDAQKAPMLAIGESERMTLVFRKP
ncbi:class I SAM-dependent methyltransferase [Pseudohalioglobus lutimaris]|uniref:Methyltransferase n=1 Tax=Pseudohalioglobus lutimaris TaxID=1737061 RepID=A0A2N5X3C3_9GAMM|nr:class I SAM-dependent methyltransferase [Pseudohalioglobus lutimaris]PLW68978.1 methyltransferase [Pseudohalioglobus lutimaris]